MVKRGMVHPSQTQRSSAKVLFPLTVEDLS